MANKWEYLKVTSEFRPVRLSDANGSLVVSIEGPRVDTERIRRRFPTVTIREEYGFTTFTTSETLDQVFLEMVVINSLGNEGWEAFSVRKVPALSSVTGQKPLDEFLFKRQLEISAVPPTTDHALDTSSAANDTPEAKPPLCVCDVILIGFPADRKLAVIRVIRELKPGLSLAEVHNFVGTLPAKLFAGLAGDRAWTVKQALEKVAASVKLDPMT